MLLSFDKIVISLTKAIVVEISLSPVPSSNSLKIVTGGTCSEGELSWRTGKEPPSVFLFSVIYLYSFDFLSKR